MKAAIIIGIILFIIIVFFYYLLATGNIKKVYDHKWLYDSPIAHRGYHCKDEGVIENTKTAFQRAIDHHYNIEFDIQLSSDDEIVVFHDDNFKRVCDLDKKVNELTYEEIKEVEIIGTNERVMTFSDFLKLIDGQTGLLIEFKTQGKKNNVLCEKAMELLKNYKGNYVVQSFDPFIVKWFKKNYPMIPRGQLYMQFNMKKEKANNSKKGISKFIDLLTKRMYNLKLTNCIGRPVFINDDCNHMNFMTRFVHLYTKLIVWTVNDKVQYEKLKKKVDVIIFENIEV